MTTNSPNADHGRLPDFIIIGAMKCGTSTLHQQLAADPRFFMSEPKEPCFFSDDDAWRRGTSWYRGLFAGADTGQLCGESSTHYTKLPTYQATTSRMKSVSLNSKFIYLVRDPAERLVSQFIHEWTQGQCTRSLPSAMKRLPELLSYGAYGMQLKPFVDSFGSDRILCIPFEAMRDGPECVMQKIGEFLCVPDLRWRDLPPENVSRERIRTHGVARLLRDSPLRTLAKNLLPTTAYEHCKCIFQMRRRPSLSADDRIAAMAALELNSDILTRCLGVEIHSRPWPDLVADWLEHASRGNHREQGRSDMAAPPDRRSATVHDAMNEAN